MSQLTQKNINIYAQKILEDYDAKNPGTIFKDKIKMSNADALLVQSTVSKLREKRGEEVIGYKIGCVLKETQKKMGFTQPAWGTLWKNELHDSGVILSKKDYLRVSSPYSSPPLRLQLSFHACFISSREFTVITLPS